MFYCSFILLCLCYLTVSQNILANSAANIRFMKFNEIVENGKCKILNNLCGNISDDLDALDCALSYKEHTNRISNPIDEQCQHVIWNYTAELLQDSKLQQFVKHYCAGKAIYDNCMQVPKSQFLTCLVDKLNDYPISLECSKSIERLKFLTFVDQKFLFLYIESCKDDVHKFKCGRIPIQEIGFSDGTTLSCLQHHLLNLQKPCQSQILRLSEAQAENIKYDQQLFKHCADEQHFFCNEVHAGKGQMYLCLSQHKDKHRMSQDCKEELLRHEQLIAQDYQVSRGLVRACKEDIKLNRCRKSVSDDRDVRLAQILLCLENATKNGSNLVVQKCRDEMLAHRKMLLQDYRLSPEIVSTCANDIEIFCKGIEFDGKTIHCLMEHSNVRKRKNRVSDACQRQLELLVKETDAGEDWRVDPVLWNACQSVVTVGCNKYKPGDARVMSCLMEKLNTEIMTQECEVPLRQLQHFVVRDYKLDPPLYRACRDAAVKYCSAKSVWASSPLSTDPERGPLILPCLYNKAISPEYKLSQECIKELKRVMRQRAISVDLHPNIEMFCIEDLSKFCTSRTGKGEEILCLQDHLEELAPDCKAQVFNFTEVQAVNIELNPIIAANCKVVIEDLCGDIVAKKEQDIMDCLIEHKNDQLMRLHNKCRASVEHYQLINLKDYHFTLKFKRACKDHVSRFCPGARDKAEVVRCLSEVIRNETLQDSKPRVSKECHQQLKTQLLQQRESIDLNPSLKKECAVDIGKYCSQIQPGNAKVIECLILHKYNLTGVCRARIFAVEKQDLLDSSTDYTLLNACKTMLQKYCNKTELSPLSCLKKYKYNSEFDYKCRSVVLRRIADQNTDSQLNPGLQADCKKDISLYCSKPFIDDRLDPKHVEDRVISCLKIQFRNGKLETKCRNQVLNILHEAALNYNLNPLLTALCSYEIKQLCETDGDNIGKGEVEECLKEALKNGQIKNTLCKIEVVELLEESKADVKADPHLYKSCIKDLAQYCSSVAEGNGRQLECLMNIVQKTPHLLMKHCEETLKERIEMYKIIPEAKVESLGQLYGQVSHSPSKKYFIVVALTFIGMIFITGMFCGRAMRRSIAGKRK